MPIRLAILGVLLLLASACAAPEEAPPLPTFTPNAYPEPGQPLPPTLPPESPYPTEASAPQDDPYPGQATWILRPVAEQQCEEGQTYADLDAAVAALEAAGITVLRATMASLAVCAACDCPSSEHYRVSITAEGIPAAEALGWRTAQP